MKSGLRQQREGMVMVVVVVVVAIPSPGEQVAMLFIPLLMKGGAVARKVAVSYVVREDKK